MGFSQKVVEPLHPACFDIVMASGILAMALQLEAMPLLALGITYLNIVLFISLTTMNFVRVVCYRASVLSDLGDVTRGPGFFTIVAATAIIGDQLLVILHSATAALALWVASLVLWIGFNYGVLIEVTINRHKPQFQEGINGGWLISVVATQSVAELGTQLSNLFAEPSKIMLLALSMWLAGGMLYIWLIALIFYRFTFFPFKPEDFVPPFWINMGAMAVSALTGATVVAHAGNTIFAKDLLPFLKGLTLLFWATATWWIPMLATLAVWQHVINKLNRPYNLLYWSAVFPLGMYTAATYQVSKMMNLDFLMSIPRVFIYVALISWLLTLAAMIRSWFMNSPGWLRSR